ncbi:MAG: hypoxanthine phosphoribosyltransferase [Bacteroidales bacterium]|nr:hypoxanthine phosphoribosyltransferase [Bacteroidales bacterium]
MKTIHLLDKEFKVSIPCSRVKLAVEHVANRINSDYTGKEVIFVAILNGSFMFVAELMRKIKLTCRISFVKVASYEGDTSGGIVRELIGLKEDLNGKHVILLEDIVDTGFTLDHLMRQIRTNYSPESIAVASLLFKPQSYRKSIPVNYVGFEVPNDFVVGWGLDYNGYGRNLEDICIMC